MEIEKVIQELNGRFALPLPIFSTTWEGKRSVWSVCGTVLLLMRWQASDLRIKGASRS